MNRLAAPVRRLSARPLQNISARTLLAKPATKIAPRRSLGALLVLFPMFFVSADMFAMLLWGELSCMWIQQYINGIYAVWLLAFAIMEASVCCCVLFHP
ncbi:unnamed protein product [Oikopleura dioica]|uniref:Uncharacterized protein n=1 Tax=Oikopleura dioica TaxID=34765 RepID=E4XDU4_OIKDI|nr:unnamed protein product [Oikopleura dioica]